MFRDVAKQSPAPKPGSRDGWWAIVAHCSLFTRFNLRETVTAILSSSTLHMQYFPRFRRASGALKGVSAFANWDVLFSSRFRLPPKIDGLTSPPRPSGCMCRACTPPTLQRKQYLHALSHNVPFLPVRSTCDCFVTEIFSCSTRERCKGRTQTFFQR